MRRALQRLRLVQSEGIGEHDHQRPGSDRARVLPLTPQLINNVNDLSAKTAWNIGLKAKLVEFTTIVRLERPLTTANCPKATTASA